jgi:hypothetical protein
MKLSIRPQGHWCSIERTTQRPARSLSAGRSTDALSSGAQLSLLLRSGAHLEEIVSTSMSIKTVLSLMAFAILGMWAYGCSSVECKDHPGRPPLNGKSFGQLSDMKVKNCTPQVSAIARLLSGCRHFWTA